VPGARDAAENAIRDIEASTLQSNVVLREGLKAEEEQRHDASRRIVRTVVPLGHPLVVLLIPLIVPLLKLD